jgi:N-acetylmuramic acid 6-phosphate (MurNAc-6-P) etherase
MTYITESSHPKTRDLSQIYDTDIKSGMEILLSIEEDLIEPFDQFEKSTKGQLLKEIKGKKIIVVGSGSSGRIAKILEELTGSINAYISGGDLSLIKPQEGFEDSEKDGSIFVQKHCQNVDILFLISASGSALFNYGVAQEAYKGGIKIYYFYSNDNEPACLQKLVSNQIVTPLKFVSGPQAITGSTRLQAANLALLCLGSLFCDMRKYDLRENLNYLHTMLFSDNSNFLKLYAEIEEVFLAKDAVFCDPKSNHGFLTYLSDQELFKVVFADITELSPTFGENTISMIDFSQQDACIRAYMKDGSEKISGYKLVIDDSEKERRQGLFIEITSDSENISFQSSKNIFSIKKQDKNNLSYLDLYNLKVILNLISNSLMIRGGKVHGNIMTYVRPSNIKLRNRVETILVQLLKEENKDELVKDIPKVLEDIYRTNSQISPVPIAFLMLTKNFSLSEAEEYKGIVIRKSGFSIFDCIKITKNQKLKNKKGL